MLTQPRQGRIDVSTLPTTRLLEELEVDAEIGSEQHRRLETVDTEHGEGCYVPVTAMLANRRAPLPQVSHRITGRRDLPVGREHRPTVRSDRRHRPEHRLQQVLIRSLHAETPERLGGRAATTVDRHRRRGDLPGVGQRSGHPVGVEVVEQRLDRRRADRAEGCGPEREVPHPKTPIAEFARGGYRLLREVGHSVDGLGRLPETSGWRVTHLPIVTQQCAAPLASPPDCRCTVKYGVPNLRP